MGLQLTEMPIEGGFSPGTPWHNYGEAKWGDNAVFEVKIKHFSGVLLLLCIWGWLCGLFAISLPHWLGDIHTQQLLQSVQCSFFLLDTLCGKVASSMWTNSLDALWFCWSPYNVFHISTVIMLLDIALGKGAKGCSVVYNMTSGTGIDPFDIHCTIGKMNMFFKDAFSDRVLHSLWNLCMMLSCLRCWRCELEHICLVLLTWLYTELFHNPCDLECVSHGSLQRGII